MEQVLQAAALCVTASLLAMVVRRGSPETVLLLALGAAAVVLAALVERRSRISARRAESRGLRREKENRLAMEQNIQILSSCTG